MDNSAPELNREEVTSLYPNSGTPEIYRDPLYIELDDKDFLEAAKKLKKSSEEFYNEADGMDLENRRARNEEYRFGRQLRKKRFKKYSSKALDNIIYESEQYIKAMGLSKLPDITVEPGQDSEESWKTAKILSKIVTTDIQKRERKRVLGLAFAHMPVYYTGVIKAFWNPQKGKKGNYDFKTVHPKLIVADHKAGSNDPRAMDYIFETVEYTVKEWVMKFPDKEIKIYEELHRHGTFSYGDGAKNEKTEAGMNSKVKGQEVWFKWYIPAGTTEGSKEFEEIIGVAWYMGDLVLKKMKHPYWDWTGDKQTFTYQFKEVGDKKDTYTKERSPITEEQMQQQIIGQPLPNTETQQVFHNHLEYPEFPYIFLGYDQWGETPLDETSRIEQSVPLQEDYDKRNQQITETIDRSRGKHVFSISEGLTKDDIQNMDMADPEIDVAVKGDVDKVHAYIPGEQPSEPMLNSAVSDRERIFDKSGVHGATRGAVDNDTAATNNQLSREGDFSRMDDLVDDTVNYAAEKMSNWILQFIKLFYTEEHMQRVTGEDGKYLFYKLHRDLIEDGMEVIISASGTDKLKAEQRAMDMAKMKMIDPFRFFTDIGASDPKGRAIDLMMFLMSPNMYLQKLQGQGSPSAMASNLTQAQEGQITNDPTQANQPQPGAQPDQAQGGQSPQAAQDIMLIQQGQVPPVPQAVDANYLQTLMAFVQSPQLEQVLQQHPEIKDQLIAWLQQVQQLAQQGAQGGQPQPGVPEPQQPNPANQFGGPGNAAVGPIGPTGQQPSPSNTSRIAIGR